MPFEVTESAEDLQLLTIEEMRAAAGISNNSMDVQLTALGLRVAECIADECGVRQEDSGESPPTLLRERISETIEADDTQCIFLARRHNIEIESISSGEVSGIVVNGGAGTLRLRSGRWDGTVVIDYYAGFTVVPNALKQAAIDTFRSFWLEMSRDPSIKSQEIDVEDVDRVRTDYWVGAIPGKGEGVIPETAAGQLKRFRNAVVS